MTRDQLKACLTFASGKSIDKFLQPLNDVMQLFNINTKPRMAAFLAQIAHESGSLAYVKEIASGKDYDTGSKAKSLGNTPEADGDGQKYKGRGLIQITGKANYQALTDHFKVDFVNHPELLEQPLYAATSAGWFWHTRGLNEIADLDNEEAFKKITKRINGGLNGWNDRLALWKQCKKALA
jgi:putative chitinase